MQVLLVGFLPHLLHFCDRLRRFAFVLVVVVVVVGVAELVAAAVVVRFGATIVRGHSPQPFQFVSAAVFERWRLNFSEER